MSILPVYERDDESNHKQCIKAHTYSGRHKKKICESMLYVCLVILSDSSSMSKEKEKAGIKGRHVKMQAFIAVQNTTAYKENAHVKTS